ncbi:unnamed protein product [Tetraodon nigroviridis]|uniref:Chromosome 11 SCAF14528, whole genome shotgun sequence n=1 Tax=Tetraodon nigroviridis TaxID=99883 RepID=Q4SQW0_TETNG|nr:unnamed protein product [Tetraodon nigroviridis]
MCSGFDAAPPGGGGHAARVCRRPIRPENAGKGGRNLLFLHDVLGDGSQRGGAALVEPAGGQVPLVLLLQAGVLRAQLRHLQLQLVDAEPLLLQQPQLGLDDLVQLRQILRRLAGVLRRVLHLVKTTLPVHEGDLPRNAKRSVPAHHHARWLSAGGCWRLRRARCPPPWLLRTWKVAAAPELARVRRLAADDRSQRSAQIQSRIQPHKLHAGTRTCTPDTSQRAIHPLGFSSSKQEPNDHKDACEDQ